MNPPEFIIAAALVYGCAFTKLPEPTGNEFIINCNLRTITLYVNAYKARFEIQKCVQNFSLKISYFGSTPTRTQETSYRELVLKEQRHVIHMFLFLT